MSHMGDDDGNDRKESESRERREVSPWEWVAAVLGGAIVLAAIGYLTLQEIRRGDAPPAIEISEIRVVAQQEGYLVEFTASNTGDRTVAALHVEGQIGPEDDPVETRQIVMDYVPAGGHRDAGLFFTQDPRTGPLRVRPMGYEVP